MPAQRSVGIGADVSREIGAGELQRVDDAPISELFLQLIVEEERSVDTSRAIEPRVVIRQAPNSDRLDLVLEFFEGLKVVSIVVPNREVPGERKLVVLMNKVSAAVTVDYSITSRAL